MIDTEDKGRFLIHNEKEWVDLLTEVSEGAVFVAHAQTAPNGAPISYPCIVKITETIVLDEHDSEVPAYFIMLFYKEDAFDILGLKRTEVKDYKYAEAL